MNSEIAMLLEDAELEIRHALTLAEANVTAPKHLLKALDLLLEAGAKLRGETA
jgi:hypothetical protein